MTVSDTSFPIGYFYIISQMNGLVLGIRGDQETATVQYNRHFQVTMGILISFVILQIGSKIVMVEKKLESPERDGQLWIHQDGKYKWQVTCCT